MNLLIVAGNPQIAIGLLQTPDMIVAHAIVFGQNDFNGVALLSEARERDLHDIPQTTDLGSRCTLRGNHDNVHESIPPSSLVCHGWPSPAHSLAGTPSAHPKVFIPVNKNLSSDPSPLGGERLQGGIERFRQLFDRNIPQEDPHSVAIINVTSGSGQTPANKFE